MAYAYGSGLVGPPSSNGDSDPTRQLLALLSSPLFAGVSAAIKISLLSSLTGTHHPSRLPGASPTLQHASLALDRAPASTESPSAPLMMHADSPPTAPSLHLHHSASTLAPSSLTGPLALATTSSNAMTKRGLDIEATLDNLGLKGKNRKRRRQALQTLIPFPTPEWTDLVRIQLGCGNIDLAGGITAISGLGLDPRMVTYLLKIGHGIELLLPTWFEEVVRTKALLNGLPVGSAIDMVPSTREQCNMVLKAITPGASSTKTPAPAKIYLEQWILRIKANLPAARTKPSAPSAISYGINMPTASSYPAFSTVASPVETSVYTRAAQLTSSPLPMDLEQNPMDDVVSISSLNDSSIWIALGTSNVQNVPVTHVSTPLSVCTNLCIPSRRQNDITNQDQMATSSLLDLWLGPN
jgi:hypothetical protein